MNEKEMIKIFKNEELMKTLLSSCIQDDFFVTNKKPIYTLKECLISIDEQILNTIYITYKHIFSKKIKKNPSHDEKIIILEKEIIRVFNDYLKKFDEDGKRILKEIAKNNSTRTPDINLLNYGFMFGFIENDKEIYIVPTELLNMYNEYMKSDEKKENDLKDADTYIMTYMLMNGIVPKDFIEDLLINHYELDITKQQINNLLTENYTLYRNYYSSVAINEVTKEEIDELIEVKEKMTFIKLTNHEIHEYLHIFHSLFEKLKKILKNSDNHLIDFIFIKCFFNYRPIEDIINLLDLPKNQAKKLSELLEQYQEEFRYWAVNGRTLYETEREFLIENVPFKEKPKFNDLETCLKQLPENMYNVIESNYEEKSKKCLKEQIIDFLKNSMDYFENFEIEGIIQSNYQEPSEFISNDLLKNGFVYFYQDNNKIKCFIPNEILNIFEEEFSKSGNDVYKIDLILSYIYANGIIEKVKLQEILKEYHDIDFSINELDDIINSVGAVIIDDKYYSNITDEITEEIEDIISMKNKFNKYKKMDLNQDNFEIDFEDKLKNLLNKEFQLKNDLDDLYEQLWFSIKYGIFCEELLEFVFDEANLLLKEKQKKMILDLYKEYKDYITVWSYNGYSVSEYNKMNQSKNTKIGRNDSCPCGSGKKYKKCCGK